MAKELSPGKLQLFTFEINKNAQTFYAKHNFKVIGRGFENEENLPDIKYEWILLVSAIFFLPLSGTEEQHSQSKNQIFADALLMNEAPTANEKHTR
jgi:hypothetical protein